MEATSTPSTCRDADQPGTEDWSAVMFAIRARMRELKMTKAHLARETKLSETTIRYIGQPGRGHRESALVAIAAVLRWRYDHLVNILHGQPGNNPSPAPGTSIARLLRAEVAPLKDEMSLLEKAVHAIADKIDATPPGTRQDQAVSPRSATQPVEGISSLPVPDDMDADYSPQYVKLARTLRAKINAGKLANSSTLPAPEVATAYRVSVRVAHAALDMLAANDYLTRPPGTRHYRVNARTTPVTALHLHHYGIDCVYLDEDGSFSTLAAPARQPVRAS
jgi:hypothetical protein